MQIRGCVGHGKASPGSHSYMLFSAIQPVLHDPISLDGPWRHVHKGAFSLVLTCPQVLTGCFYLKSAAPEGVLAAPVLRTPRHSRGRYMQGGGCCIGLLCHFVPRAGCVRWHHVARRIVKLYLLVVELGSLLIHASAAPALSLGVPKLRPSRTCGLAWTKTAADSVHRKELGAAQIAADVSG